MRYGCGIVMGLIIAVGLPSCRAYGPTEFYIIRTDPTAARSETQLPLTLAIGNVRSPSRYQDQMLYRTSDYEVGFYEFSNWVEPPAEMVRRALVEDLKASELFRRVDSTGLEAQPDLTLQATISAFDQVITKEDIFAECGLSMELVRGSSGKSVWSYDARARVRQEGKGKFVAAMSEAVQEVIRRAIAAMEASRELRDLAAGNDPGSTATSPGSGGKTHTDLMVNLPFRAARVVLRM